MLPIGHTCNSDHPESAPCPVADCERRNAIVEIIWPKNNCCQCTVKGNGGPRCPNCDHLTAGCDDCKDSPHRDVAAGKV
ncbi:hypothetical protein BDD12DRAFT_844053 [Trichophaea hybrida]|nr:hypothetical protein BDD12DRAFT_844053 [Trichophaea hybrida]